MLFMVMSMHVPVIQSLKSTPHTGKMWLKRNLTICDLISRGRCMESTCISYYDLNLFNIRSDKMQTIPAVITPVNKFPTYKTNVYIARVGKMEEKKANKICLWNLQRCSCGRIFVFRINLLSDKSALVVSTGPSPCKLLKLLNQSRLSYTSWIHWIFQA